MNQSRQLNFHGDDVAPSIPEKALFHVIPAPLEHSVSYGGGAAEGPAAILEASRQLELLTNGDRPVNPAQYGIHTTAPVDCGGATEEALRGIERRVEAALQMQKVPVILGGEHTVTYGALPALKRHFDEFGVIQFDAHADLRDTYEDSFLSHACVMRRIHEQGVPICQIGVRCLCREERDYRAAHSIPFLDGEAVWKQGPELRLPPGFPQKVYVTFDLDALDSGLMPATGTPVPGGLNWYQAMWMLEQVMNQRACIGFDLVEFAPISGFHAYSFTAAQLTYNMMGCLVKGKSRALFKLGSL